MKNVYVTSIRPIFRQITTRLTARIDSPVSTVIFRSAWLQQKQRWGMTFSANKLTVLFTVRSFAARRCSAAFSYIWLRRPQAERLTSSRSMWLRSKVWDDHRPMTLNKTLLSAFR